MLPKKSFIAVLILMTIVVVTILLPVSSPASAQTSGYLHTSGNKIVNSSGQVVAFSGVNWFGFETNNYVPHGLWTRNWEDVLDQIASLGYNSIRLPFSNEMLHVTASVQGIDYRNPEFSGLTPIQVMDRIIEGAGERGLKIILDNHRSDAGASAQANGLWYTSAYPESQWIADWQMLTRRYQGNDTVVAMDLRNEPHDTACWGCGTTSLDWRLAAERAGNAILAINPNLLILVEGNSAYGPGGITDTWHGAEGTWWGGNLLGAQTYPVRLNVANRLVYSPHDYPASVYPQPWFSASNYPNNLPGVWDHFWGYLYNNGTAPILIGEFGSRYETTSDQQWMQTLRTYIKNKGLSWTFWSLNPNSGDTGGLLLDDWVTVHQAKHSLLTTIQYPFLDEPGGSTIVPPTSVPPTGVPPTGVPPTGVPPTGVPPTSVPPTSVPPTSGPGTCTVTYVKQNDWGSGATVNVTIRNSGTSAVNGWTLTWTFAGNQQINNLWSGTYTQSGASVSVKNAAWNGTIGANGGTVNFGFNLAYSGTNSEPTDFTLNGVPCE